MVASSGFILNPPSRALTVLDVTSSSTLEQMTIKELRQLLKDANLQERGLLSRLKRKQDLVDYLSANMPQEETEMLPTSNDGINGDDASSSDTVQPIRRMRPLAPLNMPPMEPVSSKAKDVLFEQLYERYPPLRLSKNTSASEDNIDVRQIYHPMLQNASHSDMDIVFVGTASCTPGTTRGVSCTALRLNWRRRCLPTSPINGQAPKYSGFEGGTWLFDVGECTQLQVQRTSSVKPGKITKIFITHAHGDHSFGIPGLLCLMGQDRERDAPPVDIYGPEGLRMWLRVAIRYSVSRIVPPYRVHEIIDVPMAPEWELNRRNNRYYYGKRKRQDSSWRPQGLAGEDGDSWITRCNSMDLGPSSQFGEIPGGRDIFPIYDHPLASDGAPVWEVEDEDDVKVYAAPMSHGVPCLGYVVDEQSRPGRLNNELVEPIVKRNLKALKEAGFKIPMKAMAVIKNLPEGSAFTFPDGTVVTQEEAVEPPRSGRKVVICGDTADARALTKLAQGADVLIHEATNTYLSGLDKGTDMNMISKDTRIHGHSTPTMAGEFAKKVNAKRLLLNHFSARYKGDASIDSISLMSRIEGQAIKASGLGEAEVAASWDLMVLPVPLK